MRVFVKQHVPQFSAGWVAVLVPIIEMYRTVINTMAQTFYVKVGMKRQFLPSGGV